MKNIENLEFTHLTVDVPLDRMLIDGKKLPDVIEQFGLVDTVSELRRAFMEEYLRMAKLMQQAEDMDKNELNFRLNESISRIALPAIMVATIHKQVLKAMEEEEKQKTIFEA